MLLPIITYNNFRHYINFANLVIGILTPPPKPHQVPSAQYPIFEKGIPSDGAFGLYSAVHFALTIRDSFALRCSSARIRAARCGAGLRRIPEKLEADRPSPAAGLRGTRTG